MTQEQEQKSKEFISLSQASKISGYHQDYLGFLCRSGKLEGFKLGRNWVTTQQALDTFLANYKNGISEVIDETGKKIPVHVIDAKAAEPSGTKIPVVISSLPGLPGGQVFHTEQTPAQIVKLSGLRKEVLDGIEEKVKNLSDQVTKIEQANLKNLEAAKDDSKTAPVAIVPILPQRANSLTDKFSSNFALPVPQPKGEVLQPGNFSLGQKKVKELYRTFVKPRQNNLRLVYGVVAIALLGLMASVLSSDWVAQTWLIGNPNQSRIVYQHNSSAQIAVAPQLPTAGTSAPSTVIVNRTVNQLLGFSGSDLYSLIDSRLNEYLAEGKFKGPPGPPGQTGPEGASALSGLVSYVQPEQQGFVTPGSVTGFTYLSAVHFNAGDETVGGATVLGGPVTVNGPTVFNSDTVFNGTTTINDLNITNFNPGFTQGSVVFQGVAGLSQDNSNLFYNAATAQLSVGTSTPNLSAKLEVDSTTTGFLAPRMTEAQRDAIAAPAAGLMVYNTDTNQYNVYNGTVWGAVGSGGGGSGGVDSGIAGAFSYYKSGAATVSPQSILFFSGNQIGVGTNSPAALLNVVSSSTSLPTLLVQSAPAQTANILTVASSSGASFLTIANNGSTTLSSLGSGIVMSAGGSLYNGSVNLGSAEVSGVLPIANGGTGTGTAPALGQLLLGNGSGGYNLVATSSLGILSPQYFTLNGSALFNNAGYQVGINSSSPTANLVVQGSSTNPTLPIFTIASSSNAQYLTVLANGNVGIGTNNPTDAVDINGSIGVTNSLLLSSGTVTANGSGVLIKGAGGVVGAYIYDSAQYMTGTLQVGNASLGGSTLNVYGDVSVGRLFQGAAPADGMIVQGDVGIGTTTPLAKLDVYGDSGSNNIVNFASSSNISQFLIGPNGSTTITTLNAGGIVQSTASGQLFNSNVALSSQVSGVLAVGNGGTGTSTTATVNGQILSWNNASYGPTNLVAGLNITITTTTPGQITITGAAGSGNYFTQNGSAIFNNTGYEVGINSSTPNANLVVEGSSTNPTLPILTVASSSNASLFTVLAGGNVGINTSTPDDIFDVQGNGVGDVAEFYNSTGKTILKILSIGNVGVGTSTPTALLTVQGQSGSGNDIFDVASSSGNNLLQVLPSNGIILAMNASSTNSSSTVKSSVAVLQLGTGSIVTANASGTLIASNQPAGFGGNLVELETAGSTEFRVSGAGVGVFGGALNVGGNINFFGGNQLLASNNASMFLRGNLTGTTVGYGLNVDNQANNRNFTSGSGGLLNIKDVVANGFNPASGSGVFNGLENNAMQINQTGTANGITRNTYLNPQALLSTYDYRNLEVAAATDTLSNAVNPITTAYNVLFNPITYQTASTTKYTIATSSTLTISGAPIASTTSLALTNSIGLLIQGNNVTASTTNGIGLEVNAPTGAANNYAAIFNGGNVGIGTTSPSSQLTILSSSSTTKGLIIQGAASQSADLQEWLDPNGTIRASVNSGTYPSFNVYRDTGAMQGSFWGNSDGANINYTPALVFKTSGSEKARFYSSGGYALGSGSWNTDPGAGNMIIQGNVGIGTTTPAARLSVTGTSAIDPFDISSTSGLSLLRVTQAGNVGIGTTTPLQVLSVAGNMQLTGALFDSTNASGTLGMILQTTGSGTQWVATSTLGISGSATLASGTPGNIQFAGTSGTFNASSLFTWDNTLNHLGLGTTSTSSAISLAQGTTAASGINFGDATANLYRSAAGTIKTDGGLSVNGMSLSDNGVSLSQILATPNHLFRILGNYASAGPAISLEDNVVPNYTSGDGQAVSIDTATFGPASGNGTWETLLLNGKVSQTGSANGTTRGLYVNPILTSAYDFRGIETAAYTATTSNTTLTQNILINQPTYATTGAATLANAINLSVSGAPIAGPNMTISSSSAFTIQGGAVNGGGAVTNAYGLYVNAPTGATNNYAAIFQGGSVGINTSTPLATLSLAASTTAAGGINFGDATADLYRSAAGTIKTDASSLNIGGNTLIGGSGATFGVASANHGVSINGSWTTSAGTAVALFNNANTNNPTSGTSRIVLVGNSTTGGQQDIFGPTSGNAVLNTLELTNQIKQTGSANGVTRGEYLNMTLSGVYDYRNLETAAANETISNAVNPVSQVYNVLFNPLNYGTASTSVYTIATSSTLTISGAPIASTSGNTILTNSFGALIQGGTLNASTTNGVGLYVQAPTGAANNYAAIFTGGNVGIGSTTPATQLAITSTIAGIDPFDVSSSTSGSLLHVSANGNVGIGTAAPGDKLEVAGGNINLGNSGSNSNFNNAYLVFGGAGINTYGMDLGFSSSRYKTRLFTPTSGDISFDFIPINTLPTTQSQFTPMVTIKGNSGNVGIATSTPTAQLTVNVIGTIDPFDIYSTGTNSSIMHVTFGGKVGIGTTSPAGKLDVFVASGDATTLPLVVGKGTAGNYVTVLNTGNVGIGTASPSSQLTILSSSSTTKGLIIQGAASQSADLQEWLDPNGTIRASVNSGVYPSFNVYRDTGAMQGSFFGNSDGANISYTPDLVFKTSGSEKARFYSSGGYALGSGSWNTDPGAGNMIIQGNVGIGTTTPLQVLSVAGNMQLTGALFDSTNASGTLGMILQTTGTGTKWVATSTLGISGSATLASGTPGNIQFAGAGGTFNANSLFNWDNNNLKLSIGTTSTTSAITLAQGTTAAGGINFGDATADLYRSAAGRIRSDGDIQAGGNLITGSIVQGGQVLNLENNSSASFAGTNVKITTNGSKNPGSGIDQIAVVAATFNPTGGTAIENYLVLNGNVNQTGSANGITRGEYLNTVLTSAYDYRNLETAAANETISNAVNPVSQVYNVLFNPLNYGTASTSVYTIATSSTLTISGAPIASTTGNTILTNSFGALIQGGSLNASTTNGYGLAVTAPTGAANNYAAIFSNGNVGIGTSTPVSLLQVAGDIQLGSKGLAASSALIFNTGSTTNPSTIRLLATTSLASSYTLTLPTTTPAAGQVLAGDSSGNLYWSTPSTGNASSSSGNGALVLLEQHTASSSASLNFTQCFSSSYNEYQIEMTEVTLGTTSAELNFRASTNGGSSYDSTSSYDWAMEGFRNGAAATTGSAAATSVTLYHEFTSPTTASISGSFKLFNPGSSSTNKQISGTVTAIDATSRIDESTAGAYSSSSPVNAFQILASSGNLASGVVSCYGLANATGSGGSFTGAGTSNYVARWTSTSTLSTGVLLDTGVQAGVNATSSSYTFNIQGSGGVNPFNIASSTGASLLMVAQNGNVGIGTTTPGYSLDISGSQRITGGLNVGIATNAAIGQVKASILSGTSYFEGPGAYFDTAQPYSSGDLKFLLRNANNKFEFEALGGGPLVDILNSGNVGIGTTTPLAVLSLNASTTAAGGINFGDATADLYRSAAGTIQTDGTLSFSSGGSARINIFGNTIDDTLGNSISVNGELQTGGTNGGTSDVTLQSNSATAITIAPTNAGTFSSFVTENGIFSPSSGAGGWVGFQAAMTVNQANGLVGTTRGIYINPTLTKAYDFRSLETSAFTATTSNTTLLNNILFNQPTYATTGAATLTTAINQSIAGAPIAGPNMTISSSSAFTIQGGAVNGGGAVTNAYGLYVNAPTGAGSNYAAIFNGGNVGIGTSSPSQLLTVGNNNQFTIDSSGNVVGHNISAGTLYSNFLLAADQTHYLIQRAATGALIGNSGSFIALDTGNVAIGTTTPAGLLTLQGTGSTVQNLFNITSSSGTSLLNVSWYGGFTQNIASTTAVNIQDGSGNSVFAIDTTQSSSNAGLDITAGGSQAGNLLNIYSSGGTLLSGVTAYGGIFANISSSSALSILNGSGSQIFAVNTLSGLLNIATSSSTTINSILTTEGNFTIGDDGLTGTTDGRIWLRSRGVTFRFNSTGNTADYSEFFYQTSTTTPPVGTVMTLNSSTTSPIADAGMAQMATSSYDQNLLGVVTDKGTGYNNPNDDRQFGGNYVDIGLLGHIAVRVATTTAPIKIGDYITSSPIPGVAEKAGRSGMVIGQALENYDPAANTSTNPTVLTLVEPGFKVINNTFVLGEDDGQISSATSTEGALADSFLIDQKGSGNILQLQQNDQDRFLVGANGAVSILANATGTQNILTVQNASATLFSISSVGDAQFVGHITVGVDTAGTAVIKAGDNQTAVTFANPYASAPKVIVTAQGMPNFFYGVVSKTATGFTVQTSQPVSADTSFDWIAVAQPQDTQSQSSLVVINGNNAPTAPASSPPPTSDSGNSSSTPPSDASSTLDSGIVAGTSTPDTGITPTIDTSNSTPPSDASATTPPADLSATPPPAPAPTPSVPTADAPSAQ